MDPIQTVDDEELLATENYLKIFNVLESTRITATKNLIPVSELKDSNRFHKHVLDNMEKISPFDRTFLKREDMTGETFLTLLDIPRGIRILRKLFPNEMHDFKVYLDMWLSLRHRIVHEGKFIVATENEFNVFYGDLKDVLMRFHIRNEDIERSKNVVKIIDMSNLDDLKNKLQTWEEELTKREEKLEDLVTALNVSIKNTEQRIQNIKPLTDTSSPHQQLANKLGKVLKDGKEHEKYGEFFTKLTDGYFYVNHQDFLICQHENTTNHSDVPTVFLGYCTGFDFPWIALKRFSTIGTTVPSDVTAMLDLEAHKPNGHANILRMYSSSIKSPDRSHFFMATELCHYTLDGYLNNNDNPPSLANKCCVAVQLLEGMKYLHDQKYVHRDLKPNNILISIDGQNRPKVKITDFGMSRQRSPNDPTPRTKGGGVWKWLAPGSTDIGDEDPLWLENDAFVTNLLLGYIFTAKHCFISLGSRMTSKKLSKHYDGKPHVCPLSNKELEKFLDKNFQNYFSFHEIKENVNESQANQQHQSGNNAVVTEDDRTKMRQLKDQLQIKEIQVAFNKMNFIKANLEGL